MCKRYVQPKTKCHVFNVLMKTVSQIILRKNVSQVTFIQGKQGVHKIKMI